ncbi:MAG: PKD domain-containing protein, partial [Thermoplasmata archaeon]
DFGDDISSQWLVSPQVVHAYARSGNYTAKLTVRDPEMATGSVTTLVIVVNEVPSCTIVLPVAGEPYDKEVPVQFKGTGTDTPSDEVDLVYMWDFGDGTATDWLGRRDVQVFHTYTKGGVVEVGLTVMDSDGATYTATATITIMNAPPEVQIVRPWPSATVDEDVPVKFEGRGSDTPGDQPGLEYEWVIDGITYSGKYVERTFVRSGVYLAVFRVTDPDGAVSSLEVEVTVGNVVPEITLSIDRTVIETGEAVNFSVDIVDTPSDIGGHFITWEFGDGGTSHDLRGSHGFARNGTYVVRVLVEDDDGDTAIASVSVTVNDPPSPPVDPPDDGPSTSGGGDGSMLLFGGIIVAVLVAVLVVAYLLLMRGGRPGIDDDLVDPPDDDEDGGGDTA